MNKSSFIIAESNILYSLGLNALIHERIHNATVINVSGFAEINNALLSTPESVVIVDMDSFNNKQLDFFSMASSKFTESNWLFISEIAHEAELIELNRAINHANFVLKTNDYDVISTAIVNTAKGMRYFCSEALQIIMEEHNRKKYAEPKKHVLTGTELELIQLFAMGKTAKEVAVIRTSSYHTINTHRKNIFRKLEINNIQELIKYALKHNLLNLTEYYI